MNRRIKKKRKKYRYLCCGKFIYIKPSEWNKVKNQSRQTQIAFITKKVNKKGGRMIYTDKESGCTVMSGADEGHYLLVTESGREFDIYSIFEITDNKAQEIINYYLTERKDDE